MLIRMRRFLSSYWKYCLPVGFGVAVFLFWRLGYFFTLSYHEQFQLFLFDGDYFLGRMSSPGGFARYVAEFLVQFYNNVTCGALILAVLFVALQWLTWRLMIVNQAHGMRNKESMNTASSSSFILHSSLLPAIALWFVMGDENVMLTYVVSLIMAMACMLYRPRKKYVRWAYVLVIIPLLYWLIGPMVLLVAFYLMPLSAIYALACIFVSAYWVPFPLKQLMIGIDYYRVFDVVSYSLLLPPVLVLLLVYGARYLPMPGKKMGIGMLALVCVLASLVGYLGYDKKKYELIEYDYLVRVKDWNGIIAKAEKNMPDLPMSVCATNLALAMTNQLGERAFNFFQHGKEGLVPRFERQFAIAQLTGELYYHLGLVNTAGRLAYESMEALPNYNKSARAMKRLAETNLINGQYEVARKYLLLLQKTIFYRPWATRTLSLLGNEQQINQHPVYGWLRQVRLQDDFLFSEQEVDKICGQLFMHNSKNTMAMQYLLMTPLLDRDVNRFMQYMQVVQERVSYNPRICQEVICLAYAQHGQQPPSGMVSSWVMNDFSNFMQDYRSSGGNRAAMQRYKHTAWFYLVL